MTATTTLARTKAAASPPTVPTAAKAAPSKAAAKPKGKAQAGKARPPLKVRHEPPTLDEAIFAAQGLTPDAEQQVEIAAELMDMPYDEVRPHVLKAMAKPSTPNRVFVPARSGLQRAVVIETTGRTRNRASSDLASRLSARPVQLGSLRTRLPS